jgi:hypothetical protein
MKIIYELQNKSFHPGDSIKISFQIKNTCDYSIDFNHRQFPVKVCLVLTGKKKKDITVLDVTLSKAITVLNAGQVMQSSLAAKIPDLQAGRYKLGICLSNTFGPSFNSRFSEVRITGEN